MTPSAPAAIRQPELWPAPPNAKTLRAGAASVGAVMTPDRWARWLVQQSDVVAVLRDGGRVLEPTCGDGSILEAILSEAHACGLSPSVVSRQIWGVERDAALVARAHARLQQRFGIPLPSGQLVCADVLTWSAPCRFDCVVGNPPWATFANLPKDYKPFVREQFRRHQLTQDTRQLLLGASRADIAGLICQHVFTELLTPQGSATLFLPLSLFFSEGANNRFRLLQTSQGPVALDAIHDLSQMNVFAGLASTRYGAARFRCGQTTSWPVPLYVHGPDGPVQTAVWAGAEQGASFLQTAAGDSCRAAPRIEVPQSAQPRQGLNTCGANEVYFLTRVTALTSDLLHVQTSGGVEATVPAAYVYPVATAPNFQGDPTVRRWVVLPYDRTTGKVLETLEGTGLAPFFDAHRDRLSARNGTMLAAQLQKGRWWALLGVGPYCFAPWKVMWEAYGRRTFHPVVLGSVAGQPWQANQALQALMPCPDQTSAQHLAEQLGNATVQDYLTAQQMAGTMNWAQPGRIKRMLVLT